MVYLQTFAIKINYKCRQIFQSHGSYGSMGMLAIADVDRHGSKLGRGVYFAEDPAGGLTSSR